MQTSEEAVRVRIGAVLWIAQLLTLPVEWLVIAAVRAPYSLVDNTLSDLGAIGCGTVAYPGLAVAVCSPAHALFNGSLIVGAALVAVGAVLLLPALRGPRGSRTATAGVVLLVVAQLSGTATALVPIDVDFELHALVSTPAFLAQPLGLALVGLAARRTGASGGLPVLVVGVATLLVGCVFVVRLDPAGGGLLERLILWPTALAFAVAGLGLLRDRARAGR